ncbi:hypothetical protein ACFLTO_01790 [Chloroflexota bacterium]
MEIIKSLIARFWRTGFLFIIGLIVIIYVALGFLYGQQGVKQREIEEQIAKLSPIIAKPLDGNKELQAKYAEVRDNLTPITNSAAIEMFVDIAEKSGIDIREESGNFRVPSATFGNVKVGASTYRLMSFSGIHVQGNHDNVMAFISDLDSGKTLENMVLNSIITTEVEVIFTGEEGDRRAEFRNVISAVEDMMIDNALSTIPNPMSFANGIAANLTGDDPNTEETVEGFPDIATTAVEKGYSGNVTPRNGYVLYKHDKISSGNTSQFGTVSYFNTPTTKYYYTCEANGTVRQWDSPNVVVAGEYLSIKLSKPETKINVGVAIYTKPK